MAPAGRASMLAEVDKKRKALQKKLRQIEELKRKSNLDAEAQKKVDSEQEIRKEIASLESGGKADDVQGGKLSLFQEIESALVDLPDHAALLLGDYEGKQIRDQLKHLRNLLKLRESEKLDPLQQAKLDRLTKEAPGLLQDFLLLKAKATSLAEDCSKHQIEELQVQREARIAATRAHARKSEEQQLEAPAVPSPSVPPPRIGIDVGGCLNKFRNDLSSDEADGWETSVGSAAPGAMEALEKIVRFFGQENTYIISKCSGEMQRQTETWLFKTMGICKPKIGVLRENVFFCSGRWGKYGKGERAKRLNLSHFVDDRDDCLWSVYEEGNSKPAVDRHNGKFFYMARSADSRKLPEPKTWHLNERPDCVVPVRNWSEVLCHLEITSHA